MIPLELHELDDQPEYRLVLEAYQTLLLQAREADPEHTGWVSRIFSVEGVKDEHLPRIHGKLIAFGYLKFQISSRSSGVHYQLTPAGKQWLNREDAPSENPSSIEPLPRSA